jgi:xanthine dehydrogenase small subunit
MVDCHGSQCGFCTPGFVMSLWSAYEHHNACASRPSRQQLADELSGNLCRCTGYRPILDAGQRMFELPRVDFDAAPVVAALESLQADAGLSGYAGAFHAPRTLAEFAALRAAKPGALILAGSTDMGLWVTKGLRDLGELIHVGEVAELKRIEERDGQLHIGAAASLEDAWRALATRWPTLQEVWLRFASPPIRNAGTMGGNVANGSPIGDSAPVLMALAAQIVLRQGPRVRTMPLRDFYLDYMKNRLEAGEFVQGMTLPVPQPGWQIRAYKISKRFDCDISALCAGLALRLDGDTVAGVRIVFGGMAATVRHADKAEAALLGKPWTQAGVDAAKLALGADYTPLTDMRAGAEYRLQVARNLLQRFWLETRPGPTTCTTRRRASTARPRRAGCWRATASASAGRTSRRTCTSPAPRPTSTTCPNSPARCTPRSACRPWHTAASVRWTWIASARCPASSPCCRQPTSPAPTTAARSSTTTPSSPTARCTTSASRCSRSLPRRARPRGVPRPRPRRCSRSNRCRRSSRRSRRMPPAATFSTRCTCSAATRAPQSSERRTA